MAIPICFISITPKMVGLGLHRNGSVLPTYERIDKDRDFFFFFILVVL